MTPEAVYAAFCSCPTCDELVRYLPDLAQRMSTQFAGFAREPTVERAERMAIEQDGARQLVTRLGQALSAAGKGTGW